MKITLQELVSKLSYNLDDIAIKIYKPNEKGEVSREDSPIEYGILNIEPYIEHFYYKSIKGEKIDFRKIVNASVLEIDRAEYIGKDYERFNNATIMISLKLCD